MSKPPVQKEPVSAEIQLLGQSIGSRLTAIMRKQGQSDRGLAKASGVNYVTVYYLRHGKGGMSGVGTIYNLAKALSCSPAWLAFGHGSETDPF